MKRILALLLALLVLLTGCDGAPLPSAEQQPTLATEAPETAPPTTASLPISAPKGTLFRASGCVPPMNDNLPKASLLQKGGGAQRRRVSPI